MTYEQGMIKGSAALLLALRRNGKGPAMPPPPTPRTFPKIGEDIGQAAAAEFGVSYSDMISPRRYRRLMFPRLATALVLREKGWHYPRIARALGRTDHTTICNLFQQIHTYRKLCPDFDETTSRIMKKYVG